MTPHLLALLLQLIKAKNSSTWLAANQVIPKLLERKKLLLAAVFQKVPKRKVCFSLQFFFSNKMTKSFEWSLYFLEPRAGVIYACFP